VDAPPQPAGVATEGRAPRRFARRLLAQRGLLAFLAVFVFCLVSSPRHVRTGWPLFLTLDVQKSILYEHAEQGVLAVGMTLVILAAGIDLSVSSVLCLSAVLFAILHIPLGLGLWVALPLTFLAATGAGAFNGLMVSRFRIQPFAATLAMMAAARGIARWISHDEKISAGIVGQVRRPDPAIFEFMTTPLVRHPLVPKTMTLIFLACLVIMWIVLARTRFGRHLYAIGGNEEAARLSGIRVGLNKTAAYAICGLMAGVAGLMDCCQLRQGDPATGVAYELDAIAAVVIGGTSLAGGRGGMGFTLIGILTLGYIAKLLSLHGVGPAGREIAKGIIILVAVIIQVRPRKQ